MWCLLPKEQQRDVELFGVGSGAEKQGEKAENDDEGEEKTEDVFHSDNQKVEPSLLL